jgi:3-phenylpropionate/cinnamic acid dioxygenase small subunit
MSESEVLRDRQAVADVLSTYAACIDERDGPRFLALFQKDVTVVGFSRETIQGADAWQSFVDTQLERFASTQHMLGPQLATLDGDRAETRTDLQAVHFMVEPKGSIFTLWGTYVTSMSRDSSGEHGWKITRHELVLRGTQGP